VPKEKGREEERDRKRERRTIEKLYSSGFLKTYLNSQYI